MSSFLIQQNVHIAPKVAPRFYLIEMGAVSFGDAPAEDEVMRLIHRCFAKA